MLRFLPQQPAYDQRFSHETKVVCKHSDRWLEISHMSSLCTGKMSPSSVESRTGAFSPPPSPSNASIPDAGLQMGTLAALAHPQSRRWGLSWPLRVLKVYCALLGLTKIEVPISIEQHLFRKCSGESRTLARKDSGMAQAFSNILYQ